MYKSNSRLGIYSNRFCIDEIVQPENEVLVFIHIDALTASASGELTSVYYNIPSMNKQGLDFAFYNSFFNKYDTKYQVYAFKHFEESEAKKLASSLEYLIDNRKGIKLFDSMDASKNRIYKFDDLTFAFYYKGKNAIRVFWK
ncbi:hypothetical protein OAD50_00060 [Vicingaceae bacterium]|nr:hypothetical protein [Vicingaceae bacterium]